MSDTHERGRTPPSPGTSSGGWAGLGAGAAALAAALVIRLVLGVPSVVEVVADLVTLAVPVAVFDALLSVLGSLSKPLLVLIVAAGALGLSAAIGNLAARGAAGNQRRAVVYASIGAGALGIGVPVLLGALATGIANVSAVVLYTILFSRSYDPAAPIDPETDRNRRVLLQWGGVAGVLLLLGGGAWRLLTGGARREVAGTIPPPITPNAEFYVISKNLIDPTVSTAGWTFRVDGLAESPMLLSYDEVRALPSVEQLQTLECISNEVGGHLISTARWRGVTLRELLERSRPSGGVVEVKLHAEDGYTESIPLEMAADERVLVAYEMNGEPLPQAHGYPLRLLIPGVYGMKGPKWLNRVELIDAPYAGYWEQRGWTREAIVKTMSRIDAPASAQPLGGGPVRLAGIAYAGVRGIDRVELRIGQDDRWVEATLDEPIAELCWRFWSYEWRPQAPGTYGVTVRAIDGSGETQTARVAPTLPDGASGYDGTVYTVS